MDRVLVGFHIYYKKKKGKLNKLVDALSRSMLTVQEIQLQSISIESFKDLYKDDEEFS